MTHDLDPNTRLLVRNLMVGLAVIGACMALFFAWRITQSDGGTDIGLMIIFGLTAALCLYEALMLKPKPEFDERNFGNPQPLEGK